MAAADLVLTRGLTSPATLRRGAEVVGTLAGHSRLLDPHPCTAGWWLIAVVAGLQCCIQMFIVANHALATRCSITAAHVDHFLRRTPGRRRHLILDRGADT